MGSPAHSRSTPEKLERVQYSKNEDEADSVGKPFVEGGAES